MARLSGRSKGCATCRKRKIRCDETLPECSQCLKAGKQCPGAVSGLVFLEAATSRSSSRQRASLQGQSSAQESPQGESQEQASDCSRATSSPPLVARTKSIIKNNDAKPPKKIDEERHKGPKFHSKLEQQQGLYGQDEISTSSDYPDIPDLPAGIGKDEALKETMLSQFIEFFAKDLTTEDPTRSWIYLLPHMGSPEPVPAIKTSIVAASCMYHGTLTNRRDAIIEAYKCYGSSLEKQRKQLQLSAQENRVPIAEEICTPLILSFFEAICSTSPTAWSHHITAATKLLDMRGAEQCSSGICYQLFQSVKAQMIYPAITSRTPSIFARDDWLTVPLVGRPQAPFDRIMDFITCLPLLQCQLDDDCSPRIFLWSRPSGHPLEFQVKQMKIKLDELWKDMRAQACIQGWQGDRFQGQLGFDFDSVTDTDAIAVNAREPLDALMIALYNTARILLLSILSQVTPLTPPELQIMSAQMTAHSASIIQMAEFLGACDVGCGLIRLILPLRIVGVSNHCAAHSRQAVQLLECWQVRCGMSGICEVVLSDIQKETAVTVRQA